MKHVTTILTKLQALAPRKMFDFFLNDTFLISKHAKWIKQSYLTWNKFYFRQEESIKLEFDNYQ